MEKERRALTVALVGLASLAFLSWPRITLAASDEAALSIAQPLFDDGVKLMDEGHCDDEAVPPDRRPKCRDALAKFKKAFDIYPAGLGALRNAAYCERGLGMYASATRDFREVARRAPLDPNPSKQLWAKHAADEADKLGKLVPHVTLALENAPPGVRVRVDGAEIPVAALGVPIPLDPGDHVVEAEAPRHERFRRQLELEQKEDVSVAIRLRPIVIAPPAKPPERRSYVLPITLLSLGVVSASAGVVFGFVAKSNRDDACDGGDPLRCHDGGGLDRARRWAVGSTIATGVGAALMVTGVVVLFTSKSTRREVSLVTSPGGAALAGVF